MADQDDVREVLAWLERKGTRRNVEGARALRHLAAARPHRSTIELERAIADAALQGHSHDTLAPLQSAAIDPEGGKHCL